jgi:hypothetical protein
VLPSLFLLEGLLFLAEGQWPLHKSIWNYHHLLVLSMLFKGFIPTGGSFVFHYRSVARLYSTRYYVIAIPLTAIHFRHFDDLLKLLPVFCFLYYSNVFIDCVSCGIFLCHNGTPSTLFKALNVLSLSVYLCRFSSSTTVAHSFDTRVDISHLT